MYVFPLFLGCGGVFLISTVPLQGPSGWAEAGEPTVVKALLGASQSPRFQAKCTLSTPVLKLVQHTPRLLTVTRPREGKFLLSYRFPGSAVPRGRARAGLQVALLHVGRLVQDVAVVVVEPLAIGPLANHQARLPSAAAGLSALKAEKKEHFYTCSKDRRIVCPWGHAYLSPNAVVPQRAGPRVTALGLGWLDPLVAVAVAASVGVLTDHHSPLEAPSTGAGTLQWRTSARQPEKRNKATLGEVKRRRMQ